MDYIDLEKIRSQIDEIDEQILQLFLKRMNLSVGVAEYKKTNNMPIFQAKREQAILDKIKANSPAEVGDGTKLLFMNIMDVSKCIQQEKLIESKPLAISPQKNENPTVACPGTSGSNTEIACDKLFSKKELRFYEDFSDVFQAVEKGEVDYGVVPIENSTAGEVSQTYKLLAKHNFYIYKGTSVKINHVLAAKKGVSISNIKSVFSHEQAIKQCSDFLGEHSEITTIPYYNTASAAKMISEHPSNELAAICSEKCAKLYGLQILNSDIANSSDNETRFICISKDFQLSEKAEIISVSLSLPHTPAALYRMLTRFAFYGLNLSKIESMPIPEYLSRDIKTNSFDVIFYLDFIGSVKNPSVTRLLANLEQEMKYYKFLGNYEVIE